MSENQNLKNQINEFWQDIEALKYALKDHDLFG